MNAPKKEQKKILFFDTETSGFLKKALTSDDPNQAWCIQIGAILATAEKDLKHLNVIIQAQGREINWHAEQVHGISTERTEIDGILELEAIEQFGLLLKQADLIVCHNFNFDWPYVVQMAERNNDKLSNEARSAFYLDHDNYCTMRDKKIIKFCNLKNKAGRPKWPKLTELHDILFNESFDNAHDAMEDIQATKRCFLELVERGLISVELEK